MSMNQIGGKYFSALAASSNHYGKMLERKVNARYINSTQTKNSFVYSGAYIMNRKFHKFSILVFSALLIFGGSILTATKSTASPSIFSQKILTANDFFNSSFRGFAVSNAINLTENDFLDLAATGAKIVRIPISVNRCKNCDYYVISPKDFDNAKRVINYGKKYNFKVVIVLGVNPGGNQSDYWQDPLLLASIAQNWKALALAFKNESTIAGYDLLNEPVPHQIIMDNNQIWFNLAKQLIEAIRGIDTEHAIIVEVAPWDLPSGFNNLKPLPYQNLIYSVHMYNPHEITHQTLPNYTIPYSYPGTIAATGNVVWNKAKLSAVLEPVRQFAKKYKVPIFVGEFSCIRFAPDQSAKNYIKDLLEIFDAEGWSWTYHEYRGWTGWDAEVNSTSQFITLRSATAPIFTLLKQDFSRDVSPQSSHK